MKAFVIVAITAALALGACRREAPVEMYEPEHNVPVK